MACPAMDGSSPLPVVEHFFMANITYIICPTFGHCLVFVVHEADVKQVRMPEHPAGAVKGVVDACWINLTVERSGDPKQQSFPYSDEAEC